jgi:hypothetical protein
LKGNENDNYEEYSFTIHTAYFLKILSQK